MRAVGRWHRLPREAAPCPAALKARLQGGLGGRCHRPDLVAVSPQATRAPAARRTSPSAAAAPASPAATAWSAPGPASTGWSRDCRRPSATTGPRATSAAARRASPVRPGAGGGPPGRPAPPAAKQPTLCAQPCPHSAHRAVCTASRNPERDVSILPLSRHSSTV